MESYTVSKKAALSVALTNALCQTFVTKVADNEADQTQKATSEERDRVCKILSDELSSL